MRALAPAWGHLLTQASHAEAFLTPLWMLAWWRQFGDESGRELGCVIVEEGSHLVGIVPLLRRSTTHRRAIPVRRIELLATGEEEAEEIASDYVGGVAFRGREADVARLAAEAVLAGRLGDWDELRMTAMSGEDAMVPKLADALRELGARTTVTVTGECPFVPLPGTWNEYLDALGSSRRYQVTRSLRELDKWAGKGGWELRVAQSSDDLVEGKRVLQELHAQRWAAEGRRGVFANRRFASFHDEVMPGLLAGEDGTSLELLWLVARGEPIAAAYSVVFQSKVRFYQSGRRVDLPKNVRPGIALHALAIQRSIEACRIEYDFLAGGSRYKRDFALATRPLVELRAVAPGLRARAIERSRILADGAIARIRRQVPAALSAIGSRERAQ